MECWEEPKGVASVRMFERTLNPGKGSDRLVLGLVSLRLPQWGKLDGWPSQAGRPLSFRHTRALHGAKRLIAGSILNLGRLKHPLGDGMLETYDRLSDYSVRLVDRQSWTLLAAFIVGRVYLLVPGIGVIRLPFCYLTPWEMP